MLMAKFVGRKRELKQLAKLAALKKASLVVVKGRRRIGKSRLLQEFGQRFERCYSFMGLAPTDGVSAQDQRDQFAHNLQRYFGIAGLRADDWNDLFWQLAQQTKDAEVIIIFDEISWMAMHDPTFLPKLKNAWDLYFSHNSKLIFALCSSISAWMESNILSSTGFLGRVSLDLTLRELSLKDCLAFWDGVGDSVSLQEQLTLLAVTGGMPRYLEEINPARTAEWNIKQLCFTESGILFNEFEKFFSDLFSRRQETYKKIVESLTEKKRDIVSICEQLEYGRSGDFYSYIDDLEKAGFVTRDYSWLIKLNKISKLSLVRLSDNYTRFYLKYIQPNISKIKLGNMESVSLSSLPGWYSIRGLQIENLILNNRDLIKDYLGINRDEIVYDNPYFQRQNRNHKGCQIDYMIQTRFGQLYIFEIKCGMQSIRGEVVDEVKEKIKRISLPRNFSYRPVLIHCGNVDSQVSSAQYFSDIINFTEFLK